MVFCRRQESTSWRICHLPNYFADSYALTFVALQAQLLNAGVQKTRKISEKHLAIRNLPPLGKIFPSLLTIVWLATYTIDLEKMRTHFVDKEDYGLVLLRGEHLNGVQTLDGEGCLQTYEIPYTC